VSARYVVAVYDCAGEFEEVECGTNFAECLRVYADRRQKYDGSKVVEIFNVDSVDLDCPDGLTEDEREAVDEALS